MEELYNELLQKENENKLTLNDIENAKAHLSTLKVFNQHTWIVYNPNTLFLYTYKKGQLLPLMDRDAFLQVNRKENRKKRDNK